MQKVSRRDIGLKKLKITYGAEGSVEKYEALLELLDRNPNRFITDDEIKHSLGRRFDANTLIDAQGYRIPEITNAELNKKSNQELAVYMGALAQVKQTQLITLWTNPNTHIPGYRITLKGIEVLSQIRGVRSSRNLEKLTAVLFLVTLVLIVTSLPTMLSSWQTLSPTNSIILFVVLIILLGAILWVGNKLLPNAGATLRDQRDNISDMELQVKIATSQWWSNVAFALFGLAIAILAIGVALATFRSSAIPSAILIVWLALVPGFVGGIVLVYSKRLLGFIKR